MNFTTDLPKKDPLVSYIVASAVKCEKFFPGSNDDGPVYRMHAVILKKKDPVLSLPPLEGMEDIEIPELDKPDEAPIMDYHPSQPQRSLHGRVLTKSKKLK